MILYINTSGKYCELALFDSVSVLQHILHQEALQHSTVLHTLIDKILKLQGITFEDLEAIGIMNGPGSYTGLRIGLAAAKGFCYALDLPLILFNKLEISCSYYQEAHNPVAEYLACIEPARMGEFFFCLRKGQEDIYKASVYDATDIIIALKKYPNHILLSSVSEGNEEISGQIMHLDIPLTYILEYLFNRLIFNKIDNIYSAEPFYLKKVHANLPKKRF